jgi:putative ABC transport system ATP-binding protein
MTAAACLLEMERVARRFESPLGPVEVLKSVSLRLGPGEFLMITGPSGSGKSTLLHLLALLDRPSAGRIRFEGEDVSGIGDPIRTRIRKERIGMVFQRFCLLPHRSLRENVLFRFRYTDHSRDEAADGADRALAQVGLAALGGRVARLASAGEMQRAAIARALALRPALLIADEPTGNLDTANTKAVMDCFAGIREQGIALVMATHNEQLLAYATRHLRLRDGELS